MFKYITHLGDSGPGGSAGRAVDSEEELNLVSDIAVAATGRGFKSRPGL